MLEEQVRTIMSSQTMTVSPDDTSTQVAELMSSKKLQQLPVVKDGILLGLITAYDLYKHSSDSKGKEVNIEEIMTTNVLKITPKDKVGTAAQLFMDKRFKTLPVVNLRGELKGVITAFDVIKHVFKQAYPRPILFKEILKEV